LDASAVAGVPAEMVAALAWNAPLVVPVRSMAANVSNWEKKGGGDIWKRFCYRPGGAQHWQAPLTSAKDACAGVEGVVSPELDTDPGPDALH
jgi:hypothetical protein